jgi:hypothetical protein
MPSQVHFNISFVGHLFSLLISSFYNLWRPQTINGTRL